MLEKQFYVTVAIVLRIIMQTAAYSDATTPMYGMYSNNLHSGYPSSTVVSRKRKLDTSLLQVNMVPQRYLGAA